MAGSLAAAADVNLGRAALAGQAMIATTPDYSHVLADAAANQKMQTELALASDQAKALEVAKAHQGAALAKAKADKAQLDADLSLNEFKRSPEGVKLAKDKYYNDAQKTIHESRYTTDPVYKVMHDAKTVGVDPALFTLPDGGGIDVAGLQQEILTQQYRTAIGARTEIGNLVATPVPGAAPAEPAATPVALPAIETSTGPVSTARPLAGVPSAGAVGVAVPEALRVNVSEEYKEQQRALERSRLVADGKRGMTPITEAELSTALELKSAPEKFVDTAGRAYEVQVTRDRAGKRWEVGEPKLTELSEAEKVEDAKVAAYVSEFDNKGSEALLQSDLTTLDKAIATLNDPNIEASGAFIQLLPPWVRPFILSQRALAVPKQVGQVMVNHLAELFPGRVTNFDFSKSLELAFADELDEKTNADFIKKKRDELAAIGARKKAQVDWYREHRTMSGFNKPEVVVDESGPGSASKAAGPVKNFNATAKEGAKGMLNGAPVVLLKNEVTGKLEWVAE